MGRYDRVETKYKSFTAKAICDRFCFIQPMVYSSYHWPMMETMMQITFFWKNETDHDILKTFDDRIHDLRKYGFTFVTGLMAVEGILLPWKPPIATTAASEISDEAKFGVLVATTNRQ